MFIAALAVPAATTSRAAAHGTPIRVDVVDNALSVSGGLTDSAGFAPMVFVETTEEGDPFGQVTLPGFPLSTIWQVPGYEIFGVNEHSGLFSDVMSRPVATSNPLDYRSLWYWNPTTERVASTPTEN